MASFSSLGPTYDWRIKPDLVAPGDSIYSADTLTDAEVAAGDTCGKVDMDGTSMATPIAAGAFTLLRQYFTEGFYPSGEKTSADEFVPSAALLKAVMINGAQALKGFESDGWPIDPPPSLKQGWGTHRARRVRAFAVVGQPRTSHTRTPRRTSSSSTTSTIK
jgi:subtilisin family serine protease